MAISIPPIKTLFTSYKAFSASLVGSISKTLIISVLVSETLPDLIVAVKVTACVPFPVNAGLIIEITPVSLFGLAIFSFDDEYEITEPYNPTLGILKSSVTSAGLILEGKASKFLSPSTLSLSLDGSFSITFRLNSLSAVAEPFSRCAVNIVEILPTPENSGLFTVTFPVALSTDKISGKFEVQVIVEP